MALHPPERKMWIAVIVALLFVIGVLALQWKQTVLRDRDQPISASLHEEVGGLINPTQ